MGGNADDDELHSHSQTNRTTKKKGEGILVEPPLGFWHLVLVGYGRQMRGENVAPTRPWNEHAPPHTFATSLSKIGGKFGWR